MQIATIAECIGLNDRTADRCRDGAEHNRARRAWWLLQARHSLRRARAWTQRFGGPMHWVALYWFLDELLIADRYRTWARELGC